MGGLGRGLWGHVWVSGDLTDSEAVHSDATRLWLYSLDNSLGHLIAGHADTPCEDANKRCQSCTNSEAQKCAVLRHMIVTDYIMPAKSIRL